MAEQFLRKHEQKLFDDYFKRKKHPNETTDWDRICADAYKNGSCTFLSNAWKKLPVRYRGDFKLKRTPLDKFSSWMSNDAKFAIRIEPR